MLLQVRGNAETLDPIATTLPQVLGCATPSLIHIIIMQCRILVTTLLLVTTVSRYFSGKATLVLGLL